MLSGLYQILCYHLPRAYYHLISWYPRRMPQTKEEFEALKIRLAFYFDVPNTPDSWITIGGQITSTQANSIRKSDRLLANAAKRLNINLIAHQEKQRCYQELQDKLEQKVKEHVQEGTPDPEEVMQEVPALAEGVEAPT
jgi:hypothetical protein